MRRPALTSALQSLSLYLSLSLWALLFFSLFLIEYFSLDSAFLFHFSAYSPLFSNLSIALHVRLCSTSSLTFSSQPYLSATEEWMSSVFPVFLSFIFFFWGGLGEVENGTSVEAEGRTVEKRCGSFFSLLLDVLMDAFLRAFHSLLHKRKLNLLFRFFIIFFFFVAL